MVVQYTPSLSRLRIWFRVRRSTHAWLTLDQLSNTLQFGEVLYPIAPHARRIPTNLVTTLMLSPPRPMRVCTASKIGVNEVSAGQKDNLVGFQCRVRVDQALN